METRKQWETPRLLSKYRFSHGDYRVVLPENGNNLNRLYHKAREDGVHFLEKDSKVKIDDLPIFLQGLFLLRFAQQEEWSISVTWKFVKQLESKRRYLYDLLTFQDTPEGFTFWYTYSSYNLTLLNQYFLKNGEYEEYL